MASLRRHRRGIAEAEDYDDGSTDTATDEEEEEEEEEEDHRGLHLGLHSMTAKGIQHLCSELLEIKKASEQDLRANVYLSYLSFVRAFHEAGDLDKHVHRLKRQVMAHKRLVQHLMSSGGLDRDPLPEDSGGAKGQEPDMDMEVEVDVDVWELDVLLSEQRMEQALELVLGQPQPQQDQGKARVAERLASVAGNPRTPRPELLRALSGLCKLGEAERANQLLFNWHRASVVQGIHGCHIKELARMVFSSIVQASRSFVALHGHPSPHTPQLLRWAREEMEDFSVAFSEYVRSSSQQAAEQSLAVALEAAECAVSYSSLLRPLGFGSQEDVGGLMAPCIREALTTYARHLKEVVRLLVDSDDWVLGRFLMPPLFAAAAAEERRRYCLLTAGGRKFVTLVGEVVDDVVCPLRRVLGTDDSAAVQLVADLFGEYVTHSAMSQQQQQQDHRHISVLVNCTTLVSLLPTIGGAWSASAQRQVGGLIKEAAGQVWSCFCHQFIRDTMAAYSAALPPPPSAQGQMMPSLPFQVVFLRVRRLKDAYGTILGGDDGTMKKLLQELMEEVVSWLSTKPPDSWIGHGAQAQLDIHFLLEIAWLGGFNITASALGLLRNAQQDDGEGPWAADAARHAVQVLLLHNMNSNGDAEEEEEEEEEENGDAAAVDAAEELESESDDMASGKSAAGDDNDDGMASRKSSDEFISIEDDDNGDRLTLGSDQAAPPLAAAEKDDAPRDRSRKKAAAVSASSRPRWQ